MYETDFLASLLGEWPAELNVYSILFRVLLSVIIAAVIGCERSRKHHSAGLRTFIVVSLASTVAMLIDQYLIFTGSVSFAAVSAATVVGAAMVSGNSILFSSKGQIKGLTTSAGLWACELIGLAVGAGLYTVTAVAFLTLLCSLSLLPAAEKWLKDRSNHFEIHLELNSRSDLQPFVSTVRKLGMRINDIELNPAYLQSGLSVYAVSLSIVGDASVQCRRHSQLIEALASLDYVSYIEEMI
jgi:putative Mg2+ transporter-C (MgtC) family protein